MMSMSMTDTSSSMYTQMSLPHNLSVSTHSTRSNRLPNHTSKIANPELVSAVANQRTIWTACRCFSGVGSGSGDDLIVLARGAGSYGLPDYGAEVAEAVLGWCVAEEGAVGRAGCAVAIGRWDGARHTWG